MDFNQAREAARPAIARVIVANIASSYGLQGSEERMTAVVEQMMDDGGADYWIGQLAADIAENLGVNDAPWDDEKWFKPTESAD